MRCLLKVALEDSAREPWCPEVVALVYVVVYVVRSNVVVVVVVVCCEYVLEGERSPVAPVAPGRGTRVAVDPALLLGC